MIQTLAKMLGLSRDDAEASMHSERAARAVLTRRNLFAAGAAMAAGSAFSFGAPVDPMRAALVAWNAACDHVAGEIEYWAEVELNGMVSPGPIGTVLRTWEGR